MRTVPKLLLATSLVFFTFSVVLNAQTKPIVNEDVIFE